MPVGHLTDCVHHHLEPHSVETLHPCAQGYLVDSLLTVVDLVDVRLQHGNPMPIGNTVAVDLHTVRVDKRGDRPAFLARVEHFGHAFEALQCVTCVPVPVPLDPHRELALVTRAPDTPSCEPCRIKLCRGDVRNPERIQLVEDPGCTLSRAVRPMVSASLALTRPSALS